MDIRRFAREGQVLVAAAAIMTVGLLQNQLNVLLMLVTVLAALGVAWNGVSATVRQH